MPDQNAATPKLQVNWIAVSLVALATALTMYLFRDGLVHIVERWEAQEEYNHGYLIPPVAAWLLWARARQFQDANFSGSWFGLVLVAIGMAGLVLGELSSLFIIIEYFFLFTLVALVIATMGWPGLKIAWVPLAYLVFMVPLPSFIYANLSAEMQLISSQIGVSVIQLFGIPVFLEGNVIDMGIYQLQVAEACSGLRYLFPLMSFGFLCAAIYRGPVWHRVVIFVSTLPITILMNSFRIGVIGILVRFFGIDQAEGFLHWFEGWIVFMACVGLLFLEMFLLNRLQRDKSLLQVLELDVPPVSELRHLLPVRVRPQLVGSLALLFMGLVVTVSLAEREELLPKREPLALFPITFGEWQGRPAYPDQRQLESLNLDDHLMVNYVRPQDRAGVELWVAYYDTQRKGESVHSPRSCLPGGGWQIESLGQMTVQDVGPAGEPLTVNRSVVAKDRNRQLVYYWFEQRGREITNEYLVKWFIFWDSLTRNRTDGALVRVTTLVPEGMDLAQADQRLQEFVRILDPRLAYYLPQDQVEYRELRAGL